MCAGLLRGGVGGVKILFLFLFCSTMWGGCFVKHLCHLSIIIITRYYRGVFRDLYYGGPGKGAQGPAGKGRQGRGEGEEREMEGPTRDLGR